MLYNKEKKRVKQGVDCITCQYWDSKLKKCNGLNKNCFEYDEKTQKIIDGITKKAISII